MGAILLSLAVGLLGAFLQYWFTKWLKAHFGARQTRGYSTQGGWQCPTKAELAASRDEFLKSIRWKGIPWPGRTALCGRLFDQAVAKYSPPIPGEVTMVSDVYNSCFSTGDFKPLVAHLTTDLTA